jgi:hypothetical protein
MRAIEVESDCEFQFNAPFRADLVSSEAKRRRAAQRRNEIIQAGIDRKANLAAQRQKELQENEEANAIQPACRFYHKLPRRCAMVKGMFDEMKNLAQQKPAR